MTESIGQALDRVFGHPRGWLGRLGGAVMASSNAATERHISTVAGAGNEETALVVGPGPGVGLAEVAAKAAVTIGVDPSRDMLGLCGQRCAGEIARGTVRLHHGTAASTGQEAESVDVVISVNNVQFWEDRNAAFGELFRVLRPGGRIVLSAHEKSLPVSRHELADELEQAGFTDLQTWVWDPPGPAAPRAAQLRAWRPA
ncbi:class I SAM-dependent methyltransferase [Saccharomonospora sp. NPDC006951]